MKRAVIFALIFVVLMSIASAACDLSAQLLNQDPYPAAPDDYVKVVFQLNGTENPDCKKVYFEIAPEYPFTLDSNESRILINGCTYVNGYPSYMLAAYKLRVDKDAVDGANKIKVKYGNLAENSNILEKNMYIEVDDGRTDFDVSVQDYNPSTNTITFAIVNVGKKDVEALTLEVPRQANLDMKGASKSIIGSLDANDDTTVNMLAVPKAGDILAKLEYNDAIGVRRSVEKTMTITNAIIEKNASLCDGSDAKYVYLFWILLAAVIAYAVYKYFKKRHAAKARETLLFKNRGSKAKNDED
jgi:hypothetical protein